MGRLEALANVSWPFDSPNSWVEGFFATEPDTPGTPPAGITKAHKVGPTWDEEVAFGGTIGNQLHCCEQVTKSRVGIRARWDLDVLVILFSTRWREKTVERAQQAFSIGDSKAGMLELAHQGMEVSEGGMAPAQYLLGQIPNLLQFARWEFNRASDAIKYPTQNLLAKCPDAFSFMQLFEGDWLIIGIIDRVRGGWENGVDGMEQCSGMVQQCWGVGALDGCSKVINIHFQEGIELLEPCRQFSILPLAWVLQLVQVKVILCRHGDGFQWVGWQHGLGGQGCSHITHSFSGSTKVWWAESPAHLEGAGDHNLDGLRGLLLGEDVAEVELFFLWHYQPPEAILDV